MTRVLKKIITGKEKERRKLKWAATDIIRLIRSHKFDDTRKGLKRGKFSPPRLNEFRNLTPLNLESEDNDWWMYQIEDYTPQVLWPIDVGILGRRDPLTFTNVRTVNPKSFRGHIHRVSPYMVEVLQGQYSEKILVTARACMVWLGGRWVNAVDEINYSNLKGDFIPYRDIAGNIRADNDGAEIIAVCLAQALRERYEWGVSFKQDNETPSIRLETDPTGIKDLFKFREINQGTDRRDHLINWVTEHWRKNRHDPDIEGYVRKHLRGNTCFQWEGLEVNILPSQFDIEQKELLIQERAAMRIAGTDKRITA